MRAYPTKAPTGAPTGAQAMNDLCFLCNRPLTPEGHGLGQCVQAEEWQAPKEQASSALKLAEAAKRPLELYLCTLAGESGTQAMGQRKRTLKALALCKQVLDVQDTPSDEQSR